MSVKYGLLYSICSMANQCHIEFEAGKVSVLDQSGPFRDQHWFRVAVVQFCGQHQSMCSVFTM